MEIIKITDIDLLVRMRFDFFAAIGHPDGNNKNEIESSFREYLQRNAGNTFIAIAVKEKEEIVSAGFLTINEIPANNAAPNGLSGTLLNILTYASYRGRGYGKILIEAIKEEARNRNLSFIDLYATDQGVDLYKKCGFLPISYQAMRLKL